jgi:hypothetical protein
VQIEYIDRVDRLSALCSTQQNVAIEIDPSECRWPRNVLNYLAGFEIDQLTKLAGEFEICSRFINDNTLHNIIVNEMHCTESGVALRVPKTNIEGIGEHA